MLTPILYEVLLRFDHITGAYKGAQYQMWQREDTASFGIAGPAMPIENLEALKTLLGSSLLTSLTGDLDRVIAENEDLKKKIEEVGEAVAAAELEANKHVVMNQQLIFELSAMQGIVAQLSAPQE